MDAKEYLNQVYLLDLQIQNKVDQVARMRARVVDVRRALGADRVQNNGPVSTMEDSVIRILEEEAEINREIDRLVDLKKEIRETIGQVGLSLPTFQHLGAARVLPADSRRVSSSATVRIRLAVRESPPPYAAAILRRYRRGACLRSARRW